MKPSFRNLVKSTLPALIVVPAMMQQARALPANNITPDAAGNIVVVGTFDETNGSNWSILASGGTTPPFSVTINKGALLTGNGPLANGVTVSAPTYTITNSGTLNAGAYGILSNLGGTTVNNKADSLIHGGYDGINFGSQGDFAVSSVISGISGSNGIVNNDGSIVGNNNGIYAGTGLVVKNKLPGEITGIYGNGIYSHDNLSLTNFGTVTGGSNQITNGIVTLASGGGSGVYANNNAIIGNAGTITGITGVSTLDNLRLYNSDTIRGNGGQGITVKIPLYIANGDGVATGNLAEIFNDSTGSIVGTYNGIQAGSDLKLTNHGNITGGSEIETQPALTVLQTGHQYVGSGVVAGPRAKIDNGGSIHGYVHGIDITESEVFEQSFVLTRMVGLVNEIVVSDTSNITNLGSIRGLGGNGIDGSEQIEIVSNNGTIAGRTAAIDLRGGNDVINLNYGSEVTGDVIGGEGIDQLNFGSGSKSVSEVRNILHGNVYGVETTTKTGSGFAFIGGPGESFNVYTGQIYIGGGGLIINGNLASLSGGKTQVFLYGGSTLDGTGNWTSDLLVNSGGLSAGGTSSELAGSGDPVTALASSLKSQAKTLSHTAASSGADSVGFLTINGNVSFSNLAATDNYIRVDIIPRTQIINGLNSDLIIQTGSGNSFDFTGVNLRLSPTNLNQTLTDGTYTIVDSGSPLTGTKQLGSLGVQFNDSVRDTGEFHANQSGSNNLNAVVAKYFTTAHVTEPVAVSPVSITRLAAPATSVKNGSNLEITIEHDFGNLPGLSKNQAALGSAINGFVGSGNPLIQDFIASLDYSDLANVQNTIASLDPGNAMGLASAVVNSDYRLHRLAQEHLAAIRGTSQASTSTGASSKDAKGVITPGATTTSYAKRGNAWGSVSYDGQDYNANHNADFDGDAGAFTAGIDWLVAPQFVVGIMLDGSRGNYDGSSSNSTDIDSFRGAAYGTWGAGTGLYSDALVGFGTHDLKSKLGASGVLGSSISNDTNADSFQAMWTVGYTMVHENVKHGPFAGLEYQRLNVDGYNQSGPLPISANGFDVDSLRALVGYRATATFGQFRPYAAVAYAHEFEDGTVTQSASFAGAGFKVEGAALSSAFLISLGTGYSLTDSLSLDLGYRGEFATDDGITGNGGSLGVNYSF